HSFVTSSFTSSITSFVTSYVTSSVSSVTSHLAPQSICEPITSLVSSIPYPAVSPGDRSSSFQASDRSFKHQDAISINFAKDVYTNLSTGEVHSIAQSIKMDLVDFKIESEGQEILLSKCVQPDGLFRLPHAEQALSFSELVKSGLVTVQNCTMIDKSKEVHRVVPLQSKLPRPPISATASVTTEEHLQR